MLQKKILVFCACSLFLASVSFGKTSTKCEGLVNDLQAMQKAQTQIMSSMVNQTGEVSNTLHQFSEKQNHPKQELENASKAFLKNHDSEQRIVEKFVDQSSKLIALISECLRTPTPIAEIR